MLRKSMAVVLSLAAGDVAAQEASFLLTNGTAYPISQLAVSPADLGFWTANFLRPPPIKAGERRQVFYKAPTDYCQGDLRAEFADGGKPAIWEGLNLCALTKIKLRYDRMSGVTTASYDD